MEDKDFSDNVLAVLWERRNVANSRFLASGRSSPNGDNDYDNERSVYLYGRLLAYEDVFTGHYNLDERCDALVRGKRDAYNEILALIDEWRFKK